jgi:putative ABC transport system permease protein
MFLRNIISQSLRSLTSNRLRSALTMLGVILGTASVVFLLGWGKGFVAVMRTESASAGDGCVIISPRQAKSEISGHRGARPVSFELKEIDVILEHCPSARYVSTGDQRRAIIKYGAELKLGRICGVTADASHIFNLDIERGRFVQPDDIKNSRRAIVLGSDLRDALFPAGYEAIGKTVKVRGVPFKVIGLLERRGKQLVDMNGDTDEKAFIPITSFMKHLSGSRNIEEIDVQPWEIQNSKACIEEVRTALARELGFSPDDTEAVAVFDHAALISSLNTMALAIAAFTTMVGVITLLVGGVGVMNIMLISVTERTREIGIQKAIGAKRRQILVQFLAEALTITALSGFIGIALGCGVSIAFAAVPRPAILAAPEISTVTMAVSFLIMIAVGLLAGTLPALRAARLDPVEALRRL